MVEAFFVQINEFYLNTSEHTDAVKHPIYFANESKLSLFLPLFPNVSRALLFGSHRRNQSSHCVSHKIGHHRRAICPRNYVGARSADVNRFYLHEYGTNSYRWESNCRRISAGQHQSGNIERLNWRAFRVRVY